MTIVEALKALMRSASPVPRPNMMMLRDLLNLHKVGVLTNTALCEITDDGATVMDQSSNKTSLPADTVVIACGLSPDRELYNSLKDSIPNLQLIGEATQPRNIMYSIWDSYEAGRSI